ncbi:hypothetical protein E1264_02760 [Actinomadura sp. KC216]|uniref:N,N-dimethylformamidase beta subunit family domain-containing protein n=1 Tax=Actinomadura sp. KC216 TaxID=2530370 RepID=UPI00104B2EDB|nr:N,N-dimethylformamidase beta subunit family domain-containing protein [Actinomadura sp. KC216]TDB91078.1 hypothetical protein E1264_02760 [Actinomadura sp. KC216]
MTAGGRLAGYLSTWTAAPGELVGVHAALLVDRPRAGAAAPVAAPFTVEPITLDGGDRPARAEVDHRTRTLTDAVLPTGSYMRTGVWGHAGDDISLLMWLRTENAVPGRRQTLAELVEHPDQPGAAPLGHTRWSLDGRGGAVIDVAGHATETGIRLDAGTWYLLTLVRTARGAELLLTDEQGGTRRAVATGPERPAGAVSRWEVTIGARATAGAAPSDTFNGRIEDLVILGRVLRREEAERYARAEPGPAALLAGDAATIAGWNFADIAAGTAAESAGHPGVTHGNARAAAARPRLFILNHPADGLRGHGGGAGGALHLSSDDLDDAGWPLVARVRVGALQGSGVLGVRVATAHDRLDLPLIVSPSPEQRPAPGSAGDRRPARALLLLPTFTYLAYANHRQRSEESFFGDYQTVSDHPVVLDDDNTYLNTNERLGASLYDRRADGTAAVYSSRLRPILSIDPDYRWWLTGAHRHYPADLRFLRWLRRTGHQVDVTSDEDLHDHGAELLSGYRVLITGGHPEYVSEEMHDAVTAFTRTGGRLMYLGGNGFYWVAARAAGAPHRIEVRRRGDGGWWSAPEGEATMVANGRPGGLWSLRGRPPHHLLGVAFAAQGWPRASGYRRLPASYGTAAAFVFAGVPDEVVGEFGHALQGAAGDEIDGFRPDPRHPDTVRLATSAGRHPPFFLEAGSADLGDAIDSGDADASDAVRADMTLRSLPGGGAVFSVGSITWNASVTWNHGRNNVAAITRNVLERFLHGP